METTIARDVLLLTRVDKPVLLRRLFELEVPEIHAGTVEIKAIAREAGSRSKVAVFSRQEGLDPVGATVVEMRGITISFPGVLALDTVDFVLRAGEVHALMGENDERISLENIEFGLRLYVETLIEMQHAR